ncbi:hypothetical protein [Micromonospora sp. NPDC092111]|uniref:hypothetical protein n=1 Tax=Micromonospora sp. NPDC092111 TaxID=3364289 RepID=UPI0038231476
MVPLAKAGLTRDWLLLIIALPCAAAGVFVWLGRDVWRYNADRWRQGYQDVF